VGWTRFLDKGAEFRPQRFGDKMACPNDEFCQASECMIQGDDGDYFEHFTHCIACRVSGFGTLQIHDALDVCAVCDGLERQLKFPNAGCVHSFCLACSRNIIFWDETRYHLNPCNYGCPPCPNGCENPDKGKQCDCYEYDAIRDAWETEHPENFKKYNDDENVLIEAVEPPGSVFSSNICPLCRRGVICEWQTREETQ
jgi:hypothetical protein